MRNRSLKAQASASEGVESERLRLEAQIALGEGGDDPSSYSAYTDRVKALVSNATDNNEDANKVAHGMTHGVKRATSK